MTSAIGQLKKLYQEVIGGVAPPGAANATGDVGQMVKWLTTYGPTGQRKHVGPLEWLETPATDFWLVASGEAAVQLGASTILNSLASAGWAVTSMVATAAGGGDLMTSADSTPNYIDTDATGDLLKSPRIFGDYSHMLTAAKLLGYTPTKLCLEFYGGFSVASADEASSSIGFGINAANPKASIKSRGTGTAFFLTNGSIDDGSLGLDTNDHLWKIILPAAGTMEWFIDDVSQGTLALATDCWPLGFMMSASTTNRPRVAWAHIWYE